MKLYTFKSIQGRLTFTFLIITLIPLIAVLTVTYFQRVNAIETETFEKLTAIRELKSERLSDWIDERKEDITTFSEDRELSELELITDYNSNDANEQKVIKNCERILNRYIKNYPVYIDLFILNPENGRVLISTNNSNRGRDLSSSNYYTKSKDSKKLTIIDVYYSDDINSNSMSITMPILSNNINVQETVGILVARINLHNSLYPMLLERVGLGETGETLIVNSDKFALNELRWYEDAPLKLKILAEPVQKSTNGETGIAVTKDYRGVDILAAYTFIPQTKWGFVCKQDLKELNAPIREMIFNFVILFILSLIIIAYSAYRLSKFITKPIVEMDKVARKVGDGNFKVRNTVTQEDELGNLANEFNTLTDNIESRINIQEGISSISEIMIGQKSMESFCNSLLKRLMELTEANMSVFYILNETKREYEHFASIGANMDLLKSFNKDNPEGEIGNVISGKDIYYVKDIPDNTIFKYQTIAGDIVPKEIISIPIIIDKTVIAIISLVSIKKFKPDYYNLLNQSWNNINTSYSNLLSNERTRILANQLTRINQRLEAQSEELQEQSEELQNQSGELKRSSEVLRQQNEELEAQKNQVELANKLKSEFLSNMSHELRTPLNSIMALSRVLIEQANKKLSSEENNYLEIVERNGKRLLELINDILDLSKIEAGKIELSYKKFSIVKLLRLINDNVLSLSQQKGLALNFNSVDNIPDIESDESRLHQVLLNIIGNSIKFTEEGEVNVSVDFDSENIYVEVRDTGIGIHKDILPFIFDEFRQADGTSTRQYEGTGLGLSIAQKLAKILGGKIEVESELNKGTVFTVTLPIKWSQDVSLLDAFISDSSLENPNSNSSDNANKEQEVLNDKSKYRLLFIDDNEDAIVQVKAVLDKDNYIIDVAKNGEDALKCMQENIPDGIILDLMMPDMDGFEVLERIRSEQNTKTIPVIILTAKDVTKKEMSRLSANNIHQLLIKGDINIDKLRLKVKEMLGIREEEAYVQESQNTELIAKPVKRGDLLRVLLIEDNPDNMATLKAILGGSYEIFEAKDGEEGLLLANSILPDLILLDMALPNMDGEEIVISLKRYNNTQNIKIVAVTAQAMRGDKERFLKLGCDRYVSKPIDPTILISEIESLF